DDRRRDPAWLRLCDIDAGEQPNPGRPHAETKLVNALLGASSRGAARGDYRRWAGGLVHHASGVAARIYGDVRSMSLPRRAVGSCAAALQHGAATAALPHGRNLRAFEFPKAVSGYVARTWPDPAGARLHRLRHGPERLLFVLRHLSPCGPRLWAGTGWNPVRRAAGGERGGPDRLRLPGGPDRLSTARTHGAGGLLSRFCFASRCAGVRPLSATAVHGGGARRRLGSDLEWTLSRRGCEPCACA